MDGIKTGACCLPAKIVRDEDPVGLFCQQEVQQEQREGGLFRAWEGHFRCVLWCVELRQTQGWSLRGRNRRIQEAVRAEWHLALGQTSQTLA
jgi:hypothetical protein